jgi:hypothetical protein
VSTNHHVVPVILTPRRKYGSFQSRNLLDDDELPKRLPILSNAERRIEFGGYPKHRGGNSVYVGNDDSSLLWPLLGLFGLFQVMTTGAIGKFLDHILRIYIVLNKKSLKNQG